MINRTSKLTLFFLLTFFTINYNALSQEITESKNIRVVKRTPRTVYDLPLVGSEGLPEGVLSMKHSGSTLKEVVLKPFDGKAIKFTEVESTFFLYNKKGNRIYNLGGRGELAAFSETFVEGIYDMDKRIVRKPSKLSEVCYCCGTRNPMISPSGDFYMECGALIKYDKDLRILWERDIPQSNLTCSSLSPEGQSIIIVAPYLKEIYRYDSEGNLVTVFRDAWLHERLTQVRFVSDSKFIVVQEDNSALYQIEGSAIRLLNDTLAELSEVAKEGNLVTSSEYAVFYNFPDNGIFKIEVYDSNTFQLVAYTTLKNIEDIERYIAIKQNRIFVFTDKHILELEIRK